MDWIKGDALLELCMLVVICDVWDDMESIFKIGWIWMQCTYIDLFGAKFKFLWRTQSPRDCEGMLFYEWFMWFPALNERWKQIGMGHNCSMNNIQWLSLDSILMSSYTKR